MRSLARSFITRSHVSRILNRSIITKAFGCVRPSFLPITRLGASSSFASKIGCYNSKLNINTMNISHKLGYCTDSKKNKSIIGIAKHTESLENYKVYFSPPENGEKHMYLIEDLSEFKIGIYQHYKGKKYLVIGVAKDNVTNILYVIYVCLYDNELSSIWARPKTMFTENIEYNGTVMSRFRYITDV